MKHLNIIFENAKFWSGTALYVHSDKKKRSLATASYMWNVEGQVAFAPLFVVTTGL